MTIHAKSLLDINSLSIKDVESIYASATHFPLPSMSLREKVACLVFLEPSTRTRCSFEMAAYRLGMRCLNLGSDESSVQKGETLEDTLFNLSAMAPDIFIVRHGGEESLSEMAPRLSAPVVNAGEGTKGHPTQALLDIFTLIGARKKQKGEFHSEREKILFVGDAHHSRVVRSHIELLRKMNIEFALCAPAPWVQSVADENQCQVFQTLADGLNWCTVCVALRVQKERHTAGHNEVLKRFMDSFQLNSNTLQNLKPDSFIMHPGPINHGIEVTDDVLKDARSLILTQVANGVRVRGALLAHILGSV